MPKARNIQTGELLEIVAQEGNTVTLQIGDITKDYFLEYNDVIYFEVVDEPQPGPQEHQTPTRKLWLEGEQVEIGDNPNGEVLWDILMDFYTYVCSGADLARSGGRTKDGNETPKTVNSNYVKALENFFREVEVIKGRIIEAGYTDKGGV